MALVLNYCILPTEQIALLTLKESYAQKTEEENTLHFLNMSPSFHFDL